MIQPGVFTSAIPGKIPLTRQTSRTFTRSCVNLNGPIRYTVIVVVVVVLRKLNQRKSCSSVPLSSSLLGRHASKSSGVEIED